MKLTQSLLFAVAFSSVFFTPAFAGSNGVIAGIDFSAGAARGSSDTTDGGGFGGGGVVGNVRFGHALGIGGHLGYRFDRALSVFLGYQHVRGDIRWDASFPLYMTSTHFSGTAESNALMVNVSYAHPLSSTTDFDVSAGLGVSFNRLVDVVETTQETGEFVSDVHGNTRSSRAARMALGIRHELSSHIVLGLETSLAYAGKFRTGDTRFGNLGVTPINPYEINSVWRTSLTASLGYTF